MRTPSGQQKTALTATLDRASRGFALFVAALMGLAATGSARAASPSFADKVASSSDDQLIAGYSDLMRAFTAVTYMKARDEEAEAGAPPASEAEADQAIWKYQLATAAELDSREYYDSIEPPRTPLSAIFLTPAKVRECRSFIELDRKVHQSLGYALHDLHYYRDDPFQFVRQKALVRIRAAIVENMGQLVASGREASEEYFSDLPGETCFKTLGPKWKEAHVRLLEAADQAVTAAIGKPTLLQANDLTVELANSAVTNFSYEKWHWSVPLAFLDAGGSIAAWVWVPARVLKVFAGLGTAYTVIKSTYLAILSIYTVHKIVGSDNPLDPNGRTNTLKWAEHFTSGDWNSSDTLIQALSLIAKGKSEVLLSKRVVQIGDELRTKFGSREGAYAKLPQFEERIKIAAAEIQKRGLEKQVNPRQIALEVLQ